jgi:hypothetical protein
MKGRGIPKKIVQIKRRQDICSSTRSCDGGSNVMEQNTNNVIPEEEEEEEEEVTEEGMPNLKFYSNCLYILVLQKTFTH